MNELIKITEQNGNRAVSARELHKYLDTEDYFSQWAKRMFEYGFTENIDYQAVHEFVKHQNGIGGTNKTDYALTIDTAKEIAMIQRTPKGKEARKYFIEMEQVALSTMINSNYLQRVDKNNVSAKRLELINEIRNYLRWGDMHKVAKELDIQTSHVKLIAIGKAFNTENADRIVKALYNKAMTNKETVLFSYQQMIDSLKE